MRLLFIEFSVPQLLKDADYPVGGWAIEVAAWVKGLSDAGHSAAIMTWSGGRKYADTAQIELLDTYDPAKGVPMIKYIYSYLPRLVGVARDWRPDILIQGTRSLESFMMATVGDVLHVPFVHRIASDADVDARFRIGLRGYEQLGYRYALHRASTILCQNEYQRERLTALLPRTPVKVVQNPLGISDCHPIVNRAKRGYVAWLGIFRFPKNLPLLYEIAKKLPQIPFVVGGMPSQDMDQETAEAVESLHTLPNVQLVGYVSRKDVPAFVGNAVLLLSTSRYEGLSNTFLEALAVGTPIVTRRAVDPDQIVSKNKLGISVENEQALASAVLATWQLNVEEYDAISIRCQRYVVAHHAPADKVRDMIAAVRPLCGAFSSGRGH